MMARNIVAAAAAAVIILLAAVASIAVVTNRKHLSETAVGASPHLVANSSLPFVDDASPHLTTNSSLPFVDDVSSSTISYTGLRPSTNKITDFNSPQSEFVTISDLAHTAVRSSSGGSCTENQSLMRFTLVTDDYSWETDWEILKTVIVTTDGSTNIVRRDVIASGPPPGTRYAKNTKYIGNLCLDPGGYTLRMKDQMGDGICCEWSQGSFEVMLDGEIVIDGTGDDSDFLLRDIPFVVIDEQQIEDAIVAITPPPTPKPTPFVATIITPPPTTKSPTKSPITKSPTKQPSPAPTKQPSPPPSPPPSPRPSPRPTVATPKPTWNIIPPSQPTNFGFTGRLCKSVFYDIEDDMVALIQAASSDKEKADIIGGTVRLAAHDFMDHDRSASSSFQYGPDGCFDPDHDSNNGLEQDWSSGSYLQILYNDKYASFMSRADFWVAAASGVIHHTSSGALDLVDVFKFGRVDRDECPGSGGRLPTPAGCDEVEDVFLERMGLTYKDAVALMGGHTLGRGEESQSGHHGTWVENNREAQKFNKKYYEELFRSVWRPRKFGEGAQDWTTGQDDSDNSARVMLNTDICMAFDIDRLILRDREQCCTRTDQTFSNGENKCVDREATARRCPMYSSNNPRRAMRDAVDEMLGGDSPNDNNQPFFDAFEIAWGKATTLGSSDLMTMDGSC